MTAIEDARAELAEYVREHPDPDGHCDGECGIALASALRAMIAEHERLTAPLAPHPLDALHDGTPATTRAIANAKARERLDLSGYYEEPAPEGWERPEPLTQPMRGDIEAERDAS